MGISAKIIAHSKSSVTGTDIITYELEYPRFIHSELMTHRVFSRNAASSRAIPIDRMIELIEKTPAMPEVWGSNQSGMQAGAQIELPERAVYVWEKAAQRAVKSARELQALGLAKQIVNRVLEPFSHIKVVVTATEYNNWFALRDHEAAQPEIRILAQRMNDALQMSIPEILKPGEWHTPYVKHVRVRDELDYTVDFEEIDGMLSWTGINLEDALKISSSLCAQTSFRKSDESLQKALDIYDRLVESKPVHASPFEHIATPMEMFHGYKFQKLAEIQEGVTHITINPYNPLNGNAWSGNFKHWIQYRQLIPNNVVKG